MATTAAVLNILIKANTGQATAALGKAQGKLVATDKAADRTKGKFAALGATAGRVAKVGLLAVGAGAATAGPKLIDLASDAEETASKFKIVFGKETPNAIKRLDEFSKATGTSKFALREQAAGFQALIKPMGVSTKGASKMSVGMTKLATDLASFNNTSVQDAITALQSGLVGEAEPLRKFGVQLSANRVAAFAYANGIAKQGKELTAAQKAQASYAIILKDTKLAQGDATRTADSFANQWKRLKATVTDLATELGMKMLPVARTVVGAISSFIGQMRDGEGVGGRFSRIVVGAWNAVRAGISTAVGAIGSYIRDHREDIDKAIQAARNIAAAVKWAWETVVLPVVKRVLPAVVQIIRGAFNIIKGLVKVITSILTGDFRRAWQGVKQIFSGAVQVVIGILRGATAPLRETAARIGSAISGAFSRAWETVKSGVRSVKEWLSTKWTEIKERVGGFASGLVTAITGAFKGAVNTVIGFVNNIIRVVNKIPGVEIGEIGKLKSIDAVAGAAMSQATKTAGRLAGSRDGGARTGGLPMTGSFGFNNASDLINKLPGTGELGWLSGLGKEVLAQVSEWIKEKVKKLLSPYLTSWAPVDQMARSFGLSITSTYRPDSNTYHGMSIGNGRARATDYSNSTGPTPQMMGFAKAMQARFGRGLKELFYSPMGGSVKNGSWVPGLIIGGGLGTPGNHYNHVHVAFRNGGIAPGGVAMVGEAGRELVHLPAGSRVYNHQDTERMMANAGGPMVNIEHMVVHDRFDERRLAADLAWRIQTS